MTSDFVSLSADHKLLSIKLYVNLMRSKTPWPIGWLANPTNMNQRTSGVRLPSWTVSSEDTTIFLMYIKAVWTPPLPRSGRKDKMTPQNLCYAKGYSIWGANHKLVSHKHFTQPFLQSKIRCHFFFSFSNASFFNFRPPAAKSNKNWEIFKMSRKTQKGNLVSSKPN